MLKNNIESRLRVAFGLQRSGLAIAWSLRRQPNSQGFKAWGLRQRTKDSLSPEKISSALMISLWNIPLALTEFIWEEKRWPTIIRSVSFLANVLHAWTLGRQTTGSKKHSCQKDVIAPVLWPHVWDARIPWEDFSNEKGGRLVFKSFLADWIFVGKQNET